MKNTILAILLGISAFMGLMLPASPAHAQPSPIEAVMQPKAGEKGGELARGELLTTALKREKLDSGAVRLAMQSIGKLFDFRLSRAGDKYVYRLENGKKLTMLRYQRGQHVYEARWSEELGGYEAHLVDAREMPEVLAQPVLAGSDEDGEIDVEHAAMAERVKAVPEAHLDELEPGNTMDGIEVAAPNDPVLPEDPALAGKPSPDEEFPTGGVERADLLGADGVMGEEEELDDDELLNAPVIVHDSVDKPIEVEEPQNKIIAETSYRNEPFYGAVNQNRNKRPVESESHGLSMFSLVALVLGGAFFVFSCFVILWPAIQSRRRCSKLGLHIREMIRIAPNQRLACVEQGNHACLISIQPDGMSFIAPCPPDDQVFWDNLKSKTYWHQMAQKPLSDRQLAALLQELRKFGSDRTLNQMPVNANAQGMMDEPDDADEESTAILVTSLDGDSDTEEDEG